MRRLFSTFARGWPGVGLLLLRLVGGIAFIDVGIMRLSRLPTIGVELAYLLAIGAGLLLLVGLWTPLVGIFLAVFAIVRFLSQAADPWVSVLLGTLGAALAMLGPGAWSLDARLFGWKRVAIDTRKS